MANIHRNSAINLDLYTDNTAIGGNGGQRFSRIVGERGAKLKRIRVYSNSDRVRCIEVWMTDGSHFEAGKGKNSSPEEFEVQSDELLTSVCLQPSKTQGIFGEIRLGAIWLETNKGRKWSVVTSTLVNPKIHIPVGSGICSGIHGKSGHDVDNFGFVMIRPIKAAILSNISYPGLDMQAVSTTPDTVAQQEFKNGLNVPQSFTLSGSSSVTHTRSWGMKIGVSSGLKVTASGGIPLVVEGETEVSVEVSASSTYNVTESTTKTESWEWELQCPPHRHVKGSGTTTSDTINIPYEATMELHLDNGKVVKYEQKGIYDGVELRSTYVTVDDLGPYPSP